MVDIGASMEELNVIKLRLNAQFKLKNQGLLKHFLDLEVARSKDGMRISTLICSGTTLRFGLVSNKPHSKSLIPSPNLTILQEIT